ncbi:phenolic acid decarboxylase [Pseudomonas poae]|nr:phenolic acid decarboxylase [Pseudomonas poae]
MTNNIDSTRPEQLTHFVGKQVFYTYDVGWSYEMYIKNDHTIDYRIFSGMVGGRWVRDQQVDMARISDDVCKISWEEPTGTTVSVSINFAERQAHVVIFFPQWIALDPKKTALFQNEHLEAMRAYRDAGPTYPKLVVNQFATVTFVEDVGINNESLVACAPSELPEAYYSRRN